MSNYQPHWLNENSGDQWHTVIMPRQASQPPAKNNMAKFFRRWGKFAKLIRRPYYRKRTHFEISQGVRFPPFYQAYTFESKKWNLKNYLEFLERSFCNLEIIYFYHQGFIHSTKKDNFLVFSTESEKEYSNKHGAWKFITETSKTEVGNDVKLSVI